jgi:hypothetical protein
MPGDPSFDQAFRDFLKVYLAAKPTVCAHCGRTGLEHLRAGWLGETDHFFEELCQN